MKKKLLVLLLPLLLFSCISSQLQVRGNAESIVVGKVSVIFNDILKNNGHSFSGVHNRNIRVNIAHENSGFKKELISDSDGFIKFIDPGKGSYIIESIKFSSKKSGSAVSYTLPINKKFGIPGRGTADVYSLGDIQVIIEDEKYRYGQKSDEQAFVKHFREIFPKSEWIGTDWLFCQLQD